MLHQICVKASEFVQSLKDASNYARKDEPAQGLDHVILEVNSKSRTLSIIACDGLGLYERKLNLEVCKTQPKPSLPGKEMRLGIALSDVIQLYKIITAKAMGSIKLELDDKTLVNNNFTVKLTLANGITTSFYAKADLAIPDLDSVRINALKGKRKSAILDNLHIPVRELLRAAKVMPGKDAFARIFTSKHANNGTLALLECKNDTTDISLIFMLNDLATSQE